MTLRSQHRSKRRLRRHLLSAMLAGAAGCAALVAIVQSVQALPRGPQLSADDRPSSNLLPGAYTGPSAKGADALDTWQRWSGSKSPYALDFAASDTWANITGPSWLLDAWQTSGRRLIYSIPMFPYRPGEDTRTTSARLTRCAAGDFDAHWAKLGRRLVARRMETTVIRPGWEFDGSWYPWSAHGRRQSYVGCFRHIATAMRATPGQRFQFLWNPGVGLNQFPAERAYPGDQYVDLVGVDVYDTSWASGTYPYPATATPSQRRAIAARVWATTLDGERGLRFWANFAAVHGKRLAIPELGLSLRPDGHGGGDNPMFIANMIRFVRDPRNGVAFAMYFDADSADGDRHRLSAHDSPFPLSRSLFRGLLVDRAPSPGRSGQR